MNAKKAFVLAEMDVVYFDVEDVITTSLLDETDDSKGIVLPDDNW